MKKFIAIALCGIIIFTSGCATIFNGSTQTVNIRSNNELAKLYVNEEYMGQRSTVYTFKKKENYVIKAEKEGCQTTSITPGKTFDPTTLLGILITGELSQFLLLMVLQQVHGRSSPKQVT